MKKLLNYFNGFEWGLLISMLVANLITGGFSEPIGAICSITGVLCVLLVAKGKLANFYFGIINVGLYVFIAYQASLYGEVMLNGLYYFPIQFIGLYTWKKRMSNETGSVKARTMSRGKLSLIALGCLAAIGVYSQVLLSIGGNTVYLDSTSTVLSIVAQLLMLSMFAEQWLLWIIVDVVSVGMWIIPAMTGDAMAISMTIMWSAYLINAVYGYYNWTKMAKEVQ